MLTWYDPAVSKGWRPYGLRDAVYDWKWKTLCVMETDIILSQTLKDNEWLYRQMCAGEVNHPILFDHWKFNGVYNALFDGENIEPITNRFHFLCDLTIKQAFKKIIYGTTCPPKLAFVRNCPATAEIFITDEAVRYYKLTIIQNLREACKIIRPGYNVNYCFTEEVFIEDFQGKDVQFDGADIYGFVETVPF